VAQLAALILGCVCFVSPQVECRVDGDAVAVSDPEAIIRHLFPADEADYAVEIARCESDLRPGVNNAGKNTNGTTDWGLFQLNDGATLQRIFRALEGRDPVNLEEAQRMALNPYWNTEGAAWYALADPGGGWSKWVCSK
jgi:hypothetical protein